MGKSKTHTVTQLRPNTFTLAVWNNTVRTTAPPCLLTNLNYIFKEQFLEKCNCKYFCLEITFFFQQSCDISRSFMNPAWSLYLPYVYL